MQNAEAICCKVRIKTISVQLKLELGLSLAIKTSSFFHEVVSKFIRFGLLQSENKDHLSPVEAGAGTKLGNKQTRSSEKLFAGMIGLQGSRS